MILLSVRTPEACAVARDAAEEAGLDTVVHDEGNRIHIVIGEVDAWTQGVGEAPGQGFGNGQGIAYTNKNTADHVTDDPSCGFSKGRGCGVGNGSGGGTGHARGVGFGRAYRRLPNGVAHDQRS